MEYTIRQVSELTGLTASTLRFYEKEQLFPPVKRNEAGVRLYQEQDLERISLITCRRIRICPSGILRNLWRSAQKETARCKAAGKCCGSISRLSSSASANCKGIFSGLTIK